MTQNARNHVRSLAEREESSGQFAIDRSGALLPPAPSDDDMPELSLDALGARALEAPPPPVSARQSSRPAPLVSDVVALVDPDLKHFSVTVPPPVEVHEYERAQLEVDDLSLRLDNPYLASSLVPPPPKPARWGRKLGVLGAIVLVGAGAFVLGARTSSNAGARVQAPIASAPAAKGPAAKPVVEAVVEAPVQPAAKPAVAVESVVAAPVSAKVSSVEISLAEVGAAEPRPAAERPAAEPAVESVSVAPTATAELAPEPGAEPAAIAAVVPAVAVAEGVAVAGTAAEGEAEPTAAIEAAPTDAVAADAVAADALPAVVELPEAPTREQVVAAFEGVRAELVSCANGNHGLLKVDAKVLGTGRVSQALIDGVFRGTPEGSCMARALRKASFEPFAQESLSISYPFAL